MPIPLELVLNEQRTRFLNVCGRESIEFSDNRKALRKGILRITGFLERWQILQIPMPIGNLVGVAKQTEVLWTPELLSGNWLVKIAEVYWKKRRRCEFDAISHTPIDQN